MSRGKNKILIISAFAAIILALPAQVVFAPLAHADPGIVSIDIDWIVDPAATYEPSGTLVSNNLLVGLYAASIDYFGYNVTIPANTTLQVQFSQTQATWYNSSGTPGGWDSLSDGDHTSTGRIALSTLAWSGNAFYYRIWLQNIDSASTPTVLGANVDYTAGSAPAPTYEPAGTLVSNNLLSGLTVNAINSFSYTISIPSGAGATAQFSQDNSTWCNSSNNCDGAHSDTLSDGTNTILLSGTGKLNWSGANFYYKISFTSSGANTPSLSSATVNYATTCTWVGTTGDVTQASNWSGCGGGVPGSGDTALFDDTGTTTTLTGNFTAGALISVTTTSKSYSIGGIISGTSTVTMSGTTTLTLSGANTFTGGLTIKKGIVSLTTSTSAGGGSGTGAITLGDTSGSANATLSGGGSGTFSNPITVAPVSSGTLSIVGNAIWWGAITLNHDLTIAAGSSSYITINGGITGAGNITITSTGGATYLATAAINNAGTITNNGVTGLTAISAVIGTSVTGVYQNSTTSPLTLSGVNTFTGGCTIKSGTLLASVSNATTVSGACGPSANAITLGNSAGGSVSLLADSFTVSNAINLGASAVGTLTIGNNAGSTAAVFSGAIALAGNNLTLSPSGTGSLAISGGITGTGNLTITNATTTATTTISGASVNNAGTITNNGGGTGLTTISAAIGSNVTGLTENSAGSALNLSGSSNSITGGVTITTGTLALLTATPLSLTGNWSNSGTFTANSSTVTFNGSSQTISGTNTFNNLTDITSDSVIIFPYDATTTVSGTLKLEGTSGHNILLKSSHSGTDGQKTGYQARVDIHAVLDNHSNAYFQYVTPYDNNASNGAAQPIQQQNCVDGGNNAGWAFDLTPPVLATGVSPATLSYDHTATTVDIADVGTCTDAGSGMHATQPYQVSYKDVGTSPNTSCSSQSSYTITSAWGTSHGPISFTGTDGHYYCIKLECKDAASTPNSTAYYSASNILYDITAPSITSITSVAGDTSAPYYDTTDNNSTAVVYTASVDATACKWNTTDVDYDSMSNTCVLTSSCTLNLSGEGAKTVYMRCQDNAGNKAASSYPLTYIIDSVAPTAAVTYSINHAVKSGNHLVITATFSEALVDSPVVKIAISGANTVSATDMTKTDTTHYYYDDTVGAGNGTATVALSVGTDVAGNAITSAPTSGATFVVDNTSPIVAITSPTTLTSVNGTGVITFTDTEQINPQCSFDNSNWTSCNGTATTLADITGWSGLSEGTFTLYLKDTDIAGNIGTNSVADITKDTAGPTTSSDLNGYTSNTWTKNSVSVDLTCVDTGGCYKIYVCASASCDPTAGTAYDSPKNFSYTASGTTTLRWKSKDSAGNWQTTAGEAIIKVDKDAPTNNGLSSVSALSSTQLEVVANGATDSASGLDPAPYKFENTTASVNSDWQASTTYDTPNNLSSNTAYSFKLLARDSVDNESESSAVSKYTLAATPGTPSLAADSGTQITASWSANSNPASTEYYIENTTNSTNSGWTTSASWVSSGLNCGTTYLFRVKAMNGDSAETDWSSTASQITNACSIGGGFVAGANNSPAAPFSVSINNGATSTKTRDVVLALTAGSNVARMSISNDLSFVNAMQEPYSATKAWTLTDGQGQKTVYVKFFTQYGVASNIVSASINYSTTIGIAEQILDQVAAIRRQIAELFGPQTQQISYPPISESVTQTTPQALQGLQIMSVNPLSKFNLSPVNSSISFFADKLSQLQKTLDTLSVDVSKVQDVKKLSQTELQLQGLTKTILTQEQILQANQLANANQPASAEGLQANTLAQIQGVPLAQLSAEAISKMPSDMVFARTPGGLIDFGSVLSVNANGTAEQKITVVSGKPIELVIKPDQPASRVTGLITSKNLQNAENTLPTQDVVARFFSAALAAATPAPVAQNSSSAGLLVQKFEYAEAKPGVFKAEINAPTTKGEYQIITIIEYEDPSLLPAENSITAVVDPEGYVYSQTSNGKLRIENAAVSIYWLNPDTKEYQLWPADKFFQKNPVVTDDTGRYSFLVPQGTYYLTATAPNYYDFKSDSFSIAGDNGITMNVGLKKKGFLPDWFNWQAVIAILLFVAVVLLAVMVVHFIKGRK